MTIPNCRKEGTMEKLDLCKILKGPEGEEFYSTLKCGYVTFIDTVFNGSLLVFDGDAPTLNYDGTLGDGVECVLFPSEEERNWMKWRIGKSAEALVKLHQRIEDGYGGVPTLEEWQALGLSNSFYNIEVNVVTGMLEIVAGTNLSLIGFHTAEQAEDFMAYPDNVQLIKDLFMI